MQVSETIERKLTQAAGHGRKEQTRSGLNTGGPNTNQVNAIFRLADELNSRIQAESPRSGDISLQRHRSRRIHSEEDLLGR